MSTMTQQEVEELLSSGESLSADVYRQLGEKAAYVQARGFETMQMEQMILQYVRAHGQITRREAAELCQIKDYQAKYLLQKIVREGKLKQIGQRRVTHYQGSEMKSLHFRGGVGKQNEFMGR